MKYRNLGKSGLKVSEIALGNWLTHGSLLNFVQARDCVETAVEAGINTFDTADEYSDTSAEEILGRVLASHRRESYILATKVYWATGGDRTGPNDRGLSRKHILESINGSLKRLQVEHVDIYQAHRFDATVPLEETILAFADVVRSGKSVYIGVSEWSAENIEAAVELARELKVPLISNQPQYSMICRQHAKEVFPVCDRLGIGQIVWSPLAQGILTGKYLPDKAPPPGSRAADENGGSESINAFMEPDLLNRIQGLRVVASQIGLTTAQLALAWALRNTNVAAVICGASKPEQIRENADASGVTLGDDVMQAIDEVLGPEAHRPLKLP
jgi:voltage-dependent potassium channel beta subunit